MKFKDYFYYSKEFNRNNKREAKTTCFGFFFSMFLVSIILLLFLWINSISTAINDEHTISSLNCHFNMFGADSPRIFNCEEEQHKGVYGISYNKIRKGFSTERVDYPSITIDGFTTKTTEEFLTKNKISLSGFTTCYDNKLYLKSEEDYMKKCKLGNVMLAGKTFSNNKKEIIVSNMFLNAFGFTEYESAIGKKITYKLIFNTEYDIKYDRCLKKIKIKNKGELIDVTNDFIGYEYELFSDFTIVGVYNSKIDFCPTRRVDAKLNDDITFSSFWVKCSDITPMCYNYEKNIINGREQENENVYVYDTNPIETIENTEGIHIPILEKNHKYGYKNVTIQFKDAETAYDYYVYVENNYGKNTHIEINRNLRAIFDFYPYYTFLRTLLLTIMLCIIVVSLLNVIRIIDYSFYKDKEFNLMLKNIGMRNKNIYIFQYFKFLYEYFKALILLLILSIPIDILHYNSFNIFIQKGYIGTIKFNISFGWYFAIYFFSTFSILLLITMILIMSFIFNRNRLKGSIKND